MLSVNEGWFDRLIRIVIGGAMLAAYFVYPEASWRMWALIGIIPLLTGLVGWCPLYSVLGIRTCAARRA
jgi:hypothetical protein